MNDDPNVPPPSAPAETGSAPPPLPPRAPPPVMPLGYSGPATALLPPGKIPFAQQAARASWVAPVIALGLGCLTNTARQDPSHTSRTAELLIGGVNVCLILTGFVLGIVALFGIRRYGREKILAPALTGIILNGFFVAIFGLGIVALVHMRAIAAKSAAPPGGFGGLSAPPITTEQVTDSIERSPGWVGTAQVGGAAIVALSVAADTPLAREVREAFGTDGQPMDVVIDNTAGRADFTLDPGDFSVVLKDGSTRPALAPDDLLRTAKLDKRQLMAAYPWSAALPAGAPNKAAILLFVPADVDPAQIDHAEIVRDSKRVTVLGQFLSVEQKAANLARSREAASQPAAAP